MIYDLFHDCYGLKNWDAFLCLFVYFDSFLDVFNFFLAKSVELGQRTVVDDFFEIFQIFHTQFSVGEMDGSRP